MIRCALVIASLALVACTDVRPPAEVKEPARPKAAGAPIRTDHTRYVLREGPFGPETTIITTFSAPPSHPLYILNCNGAISLGLQRLVGDEWVHAWAAEINGCFSEPIVIPAGGSRTETMVVASGADAAVDSRTTEGRIESGTYRASWYGVLSSFDFHAPPSYGEEVPLEQRVSAPFVIERAPPRDPAHPSPDVRPREITSVEPAHGSSVAGRTPVRVKFDFARTGFRVAGTPRLYVDREDVTEKARASGTDDVPPSRLELEYVPPRAWASGRHDIRVVYLQQKGKYFWYAWSFTTPDH